MYWDTDWAFEKNDRSVLRGCTGQGKCPQSGRVWETHKMNPYLDQEFTGLKILTPEYLGSLACKFSGKLYVLADRALRICKFCICP